MQDIRYSVFAKDLDQPCPTQMAYGANNCVTVLPRAAQWKANLDLSKLNVAQANVLKALESQLQW